ncbi:spherulation-specific family 4 protein [Actimicrobium antarcticum]|uniref:Spherulation-specific family 4 n=1 Tax=Actimicrobium antarcticum TaxID=1051899 RepID=A0ABP7TRL9_9BURK
MTSVSRSFTPLHRIVRAVYSALCLMLFATGTQAAIYREALVPAYFYPSPNSTAWHSLNLLAKQMPTTAIMNPNSGPGTRLDPNYVTAIERLHVAGGKVIAYVSTSYGNRRLSDVTKDINTYLAFYKVDGFFIDEMTNDSSRAHLQYYQSLYNYVKALSPTYTVTGNPGTNVPEQYATLPLADKFVVFEDSLQNFKRYVAPAWMARHPASRFASIVHTSPRTQMAVVMKLNSTRGIAGLFVTSLGMPDPYFKLPARWGADVSQAVSLQ